MRNQQKSFSSKKPSLIMQMAELIEEKERLWRKINNIIAKADDRLKKKHKWRVDQVPIKWDWYWNSMWWNWRADPSAPNQRDSKAAYPGKHKHPYRVRKSRTKKRVSTKRKVQSRKPSSLMTKKNVVGILSTVFLIAGLGIFIHHFIWRLDHDTLNSIQAIKARIPYVVPGILCLVLAYVFSVVYRISR